MEHLKNVFSSMKTKNGQPLRPLTIHNYMKKLDKMAIMMTGKPFTTSSIGWMNNSKAIIDKLNSSGLKSLKDYITPIVKYLKLQNVDNKIIESYAKYMNDSKASEDHQRKDNLANHKEIKNAMTIDDILAKLKNFDIYDSGEIDAMKLVHKLIVSLYFQNDLIARNNYFNMKIANANKKNSDLNHNFNYVLVTANKDPKTFVMCNYKTSSTYGCQRFPITNPELKQLLKLYITEFEKNNGDFLFVDKNGEPFKSNNFNDLILQSMKAVLGKPINIDLIRKIWITTFMKDGLKSENEKEAFARRLLHSAEKQKEYVKVNLFDDDKKQKQK
jgi:hypothetical protein